MAGEIGDLLANSSPYRAILIRVRGGQERLFRDLLETPRIEKVNLAGEEIAAEINGDEDACCDLLTGLIGRGHRVIEFKLQRANLEEIFMNVTKGAVQ